MIRKLKKKVQSHLIVCQSSAGDFTYTSMRKIVASFVRFHESNGHDMMKSACSIRIQVRNKPDMLFSTTLSCNDLAIADKRQPTAATLAPTICYQEIYTPTEYFYLHIYYLPW